MSGSLFGDGLGTLDYIVVIAVFALSTAIGLYFALRSGNKNTSHYLVSSKNIGLFPLIVSSVATGLSAFTVMAQPADAYGNGFQIVFACLTPIPAVLFSMQTILPVFFQLNVSTANQYIEYRFNRLLRIFPAMLSLLQYILVLASLSHLTAMICSDALRISYWSSMALICGTCTIYSSVGGFTAVIWTDVLQALVMTVSIGVLVIKGTIDEGGVSKIWNINYEGNRTVFWFSQDNETNYSIWSMTFGVMVFSIGFYTNSQAMLQRQLANKRLLFAKMTTLFSVIITEGSYAIMCWFGLVLYAHYHSCDPLLNKQIQSRDQMVILFASNILKDTNGLIGLLIAGIMAATLSTLSSFFNAASTIVIVDFIRPMFPDLKDTTITFVSKLIGLLYGAVTIATTLIVGHLGSIKQLAYMISGTTVGPSTGIFILGIFFPWANSSGATCGYLCALSICVWAAIGRFLSVTSHYSLPVRTDGCGASAFNYVNRTILTVGSNYTSAFNGTASSGLSEMISKSENQTLLVLQSQRTEDIFFLYRITPIWYGAIAVMVVLVVGLIISIVTGIQNPDKLDPRFISPFTWSVLGRLSVKHRKMLGFKSERFHGDMKLSAISNGFIMRKFPGTETTNLDHPLQKSDNAVLYQQ